MSSAGKPITRKDQIAFAVIVFAIVLIISPFLTPQVPFLDPTLFLLTIILVIGVAYVALGIVLFLTKETSES